MDIENRRNEKWLETYTVKINRKGCCSVCRGCDGSIEVCWCSVVVVWWYGGQVWCGSMVV